MFPGGGQPDMAQILAQAQQMQQRLADAQDELARTQVQGTAGGGMVTATVSGAGEVLALGIAPAACDPDDTETLADLVVAAIRDATAAAADLQEQLMAPLTEVLGGGGLGLEGFGGGAAGIGGPGPGLGPGFGPGPGPGGPDGPGRIGL